MDNKSTENFDYSIYSPVDDPERWPLLEFGVIQNESPAEEAPEEKIDSDAPAPSDGFDFDAAPQNHHSLMFFQAVSFEDFDRAAPPLSDEVLMPEQRRQTKLSPMSIPTSDFADPNAPERRSRAQMAVLTEGEKREHTLARNRLHSAAYVQRGKEKVSRLEEKRKDLEAKLSELKARNNERKAILYGRGVEWQRLEKIIIQPIALKHQHLLQKKEEAVRKLIAEFDSIGEQATRTTKSGTLASKRSRTNRKLKIAELERDIFSLEVTVMQEEAVRVGLDEYLKEDADYISHEESENSNTLHLPSQPPFFNTSIPLSQSNFSGPGVPLLPASFETHRVHPSTNNHNETHVDLPTNFNASWASE